MKDSPTYSLKFHTTSDGSAQELLNSFKKVKPGHPNVKLRITQKGKRLFLNFQFSVEK